MRRIKSIREELLRVRPLLRVVVGAKRVKHDRSVFFEVDIAKFTVPSNDVLVCDLSWRVESHTLVDQLVQEWELGYGHIMMPDLLDIADVFVAHELLKLSLDSLH